MALYEFLKNYFSILFPLIILISFQFYAGNINCSDISQFYNNNLQSFDILFKAIIMTILILVLFFLFSKYLSKNILVERCYNSYLKMIRAEDYDEITKITTETEKDKLFKSEEFIKMVMDKGEDESKWNWQLRDKFRGKANYISDDNLSEIDVSSDEELY